MLKLTKNLLRDKKLLFAVAIAILILYLSLMKMPKYNISISNIDKWQHSFAYTVLSLSWLFALQKFNKNYLIIISCISFGIIIEILQETVTSYRTGDFLDIIANSVGVLLGLLIFSIFFKKKEVKK